LASLWRNRARHYNNISHIGSALAPRRIGAALQNDSPLCTAPRHGAGKMGNRLPWSGGLFVIIRITRRKTADFASIDTALRAAYELVMYLEAEESGRGNGTKLPVGSCAGCSPESFTVRKSERCRGLWRFGMWL